MKKIAIGLAVALPLLGCAGNQLQATGGSRSDGVVEMSLEYPAGDTLKYDEATALTTAVEHCKAWGYSGAQAFGGRQIKCSQNGPSGCVTMLATVPYQCTGGPGR